MSKQPPKGGKKKEINIAQEVAPQISDQAVMEQIEKLKQMIYSTEVQQLIAPSLTATNQEDSKELNDSSQGKKKKKNKKAEESILNGFIPADKYKFYVPQPKSTQGKMWPSECLPLSEYYFLDNIAQDELQEFFDKEEKNSFANPADKYDNEYTLQEIESISRVKMQMYNRFNQVVSEVINKIYDGHTGEDLLPYYSEIASYIWRMNQYFAFETQLLFEVIHYQIRYKIIQVISQFSYQLQRYGLVWGYDKSYCLERNIMSSYQKEDSYLFLPRTFTPNYEAALSQLIQISEIILKSSDILEDLLLQMIECLHFSEYSPVTQFKGINLYLLNCYISMSQDPFVQAFVGYAETQLVNNVSGPELERLQALLERLRPIKEYEGGPGIYIKQFLKTHRRSFHFNKHFKIDKKEHLDIRYQFYLDARDLAINLQRPPCCSQFNPDHTECGCNKINIVELVLGKQRSSNRRNKMKNGENDPNNPDSMHDACSNQYCKYCGAPIFESKSLELKLPDVLKSRLTQSSKDSKYTKMGIDDLLEFIEKGPKKPAKQVNQLAIMDEQEPKKKNRRKKNKKKGGDPNNPSQDANMIASSGNNEDDDEEDEEFMKFQQRMEEMNVQAQQNQQQKISFDGQWIDSLKQRLQD